MSQKALIIPEKYGPFKVADWDIPKPNAGEILVKVCHSIGLKLGVSELI